MRKTAICFTKKGSEVIERINEESKKRGLSLWEAYISVGVTPASTGGRQETGFSGGRQETGFSGGRQETSPGFTRVTGSLDDWTRAHFGSGHALLFVGAVGIAVRALAGLPKDKLSDSPVLVVDDNARFVIPILSGHMQGANKMAAVLAQLIGAVCVITTSTDVNGAFSADVFAAEHRLNIRNREGIKAVSAKAIEGKGITLSIKNYPPSQPVDVIVADDTDAEYSLLLSPKPYTVGLGMKKGKDAEEVERFFLGTLQEAGIRTEEVYAICTIDLKEEEAAIRALRDKYRIPVLAFDKDLLMKVDGAFHSSDFVYRTVGVDNVCERAAVLGAGPGGSLICHKCCGDGMTIAIGKRNR